MSDLAEFVLARIAEEEAGAPGDAVWEVRRVHDWPDDGSGNGYDEYLLYESGGEYPITPAGGEMGDYGMFRSTAAHIARHDPARVLAECAAYRRIVEAHPLVTDPQRLVPVWSGTTPGVACETCGGGSVDSKSPLEDIGPCETLLALASIWAGHPEFQDWR